MPKFRCSYAYDVPHYADFVVDAENERDAQAIIEKAFTDGKFNRVVCCQNDEDSAADERVFVGCELDSNTATIYPTMQELIEGSK